MPNQAGDKEPVELKAGHPPAVKVGNMRVTQRTHSTSSDKHVEEVDQAERKASVGSGDVPSACSFAPKTVVEKGMGGVTESVAHQHNEQAVKHIHEKPQASHEYRNQSNRPNVIQQPTK